MDAFRIQGGTRLAGRIAVDGSKNASLPLMAAALLADGPVTLRGIPDLSDSGNMTRLLAELGCHADRTHGTVTLRNTDTSRVHARYDLVKTMRASICVLGPLVARRKKAVVSMPGGCSFGDRPVDLHLMGLKALGAKVELQGGNIIVTSDRLKGATVFLGGPFGSTVLGTANVMSAATLAKGRTVIECAACEPEVVDLANLLNAMGAKMSGAGSPRIVVEGVEQLHEAEHRIIPDRIVAGTYAIAAGITNGDVILQDFPYDYLLAMVDRLEAVGVHVVRLHEDEDPRCCTVQVTCERRLKPAIVTTQPHPGFPTDLQAQMMALLSIADGNSIITEKIYPERFLHVAELTRMGANLFRQGPTVVVQGVGQLKGAPVMASDLRASASLLLAGLVAEGETIISRVYHIDRGYSRLEETMNAMGAKIERFREGKITEEHAATATVSSSVPMPMVNVMRGAGFKRPAAAAAD